MILYVNGDSHAAAAEAVNPHAFAEDDTRYFYMGRAPHPENLSVSWARRLSDVLKATLMCQAESASSNARIMRTTREWIDTYPSELDRTLMIIQWSTWEREEWLIDGVYYQINASGTDTVPEDHADAYKEYVTKINWPLATSRAHESIWQFHQELKEKGIKHIFFNGNNHFGNIPASERKIWGNNYIDPYDAKMTYHQRLSDQGYTTVSPNSWHFGETAHAAWAKSMLQYIVKHKMVPE